MHAGDWYFVGPDNGLFSYVMAEQRVHAAVLFNNSSYHLPSVSSTFHGRDILAPVGAYIARELNDLFFDLGSPVDPSSLQHLEGGGAIREDSTVHVYIVHIDSFGNLITSIPLTAVPELFIVPQIKMVF